MLGDLADAPAEVMRNVVHDRTVRVAETDADGASDDASEAADDEAFGGNDRESNADGADDAASSGDDDGSAGDESTVVGFVGFDAMPGTVRVTYLRGTRDARERLLEEPVRFARKEGMSVEALVPEDEEETREVVEAAGFRRTGTGPRFEGGRTLEYQLDPAAQADSARR